MKKLTLKKIVAAAKAASDEIRTNPSRYIADVTVVGFGLTFGMMALMSNGYLNGNDAVGKFFLCMATGCVIAFGKRVISHYFKGERPLPGSTPKQQQTCAR